MPTPPETRAGTCIKELDTASGVDKLSSVKAKGPTAPRISYLVKWVERGIRLRLDDALSPYGISTPEYTALSVLRERQGLSSAQLARRVFVTAQAMNQIVIALESRGLIRRIPSENHARTMCASLTEKGAALLATCDRATLPIEQLLLSELSRIEATTLRRALSVCVSSLNGLSEAN
jgi:DNA-binding MarR family transcriptional regulator